MESVTIIFINNFSLKQIKAKIFFTLQNIKNKDFNQKFIIFIMVFLTFPI
jgi:hypothetical protein